VVEPILDMAAGRSPVSGRFAAVAADSTYTFIAVTSTEDDAIQRLVGWVHDDEFPKRPVAIADLAAGAVHAVEVLVAPAAAVRHQLRGGIPDVPHLV
jgi:hypothetical protein